MSVAFRREGDEEHKEPTFDIPIAPGANLVTARGRRLIEARVAAIEAELATVPEDARAALKRDLRYWHTRRATAEVVAAPRDGSVGVGSRVAYRSGAEERTVTIVGGDEADPGAGLIGFQAPLARALMRAAEGDEVTFADKAVEVLTVEAVDGEG